MEFTEKDNIYLVTRRGDFYEGIWPSERMASEDTVKGWMSEQDVIGLDIETSNLSPFMKGRKLHSIQVGNNDIQFVIDTDSVPIDQFRPLLEDKKKKYVGHNLKFEYVYLAYFNIILRMGTLEDTFVGETCLSRGLHTPRNLEYVANKYLGVSDLSKKGRMDVAEKGVTTKENIIYAGRDVKYLHPILARQKEEMVRWDVTEDYKQECEAIIPIGYVEYSGIGFKLHGKDRNDYSWSQRFQEAQADLVIRRHLMDKHHNRLTPGFAQEYYFRKEYKDDIREKNIDLSEWDPKDKSLKEYIREYYPEMRFYKVPTENWKVNWDSNPVVLAWFKEIGIDLWSTKEEKDKVDKKTLTGAKLQADPEVKEIIDDFLIYRARSKDISTYGMNWEAYVMEDKRIHTKFSLEVSTSRMACGNTKSGPFPNIQNPPSDALTRSCFIALGANQMICADYPDQEGHVLAHKTGDKDLIDFYETGKGDKHAYTASIIWKIPFEDIKEAKRKKESNEPLTPYDLEMLDYRQKAKSANFAIAYGGTGFTIADNLGIPPEEGDRIYDAYIDAFPGLKTYFARQRKFVWEHGYVLVDETTGKKVWMKQFDVWKKLDEKWGAVFSNTRKFYSDIQTLESEKNRDKIHPKYGVTCAERAEYMRALRKRWSKQKTAMGRLALNYPIQGTAAIMTKRAAKYFYLEVIEPGLDRKNRGAFGKIRIPNIVHDEILVESWEDKLHENQDTAQYFVEPSNNIEQETLVISGGLLAEGHFNRADKLKKILEGCMERASKELCSKAPMEVKADIAKHWVH